MSGDEYEIIFNVGDLVTRDGTDIHRVTSSNNDGYGNIDVVCVKATESTIRWCEVGDEETNLARRYELVSRASEQKDPPSPDPEFIQHIKRQPE